MLGFRLSWFLPARFNFSGTSCGVSEFPLQLQNFGVSGRSGVGVLGLGCRDSEIRVSEFGLSGSGIPALDLEGRFRV